MSLEDIRAIQTRLDSLQDYISKIPKSVGIINLKQLIDAACALFPFGTHYDHVIQNINKHLPDTITAKLSELQAQCAKLSEPYASHIISESVEISTQLQTFRNSHLRNTPQISTLHALLNQLHSLQ